MITTTAMSMDRILVRIVEGDDKKRPHDAFKKILPGGVIVEVRELTKQVEDLSGYDCVIDQASSIKKLGDKEVALFKTIKDRRAPTETFAIVL